MVTVLEVTPNVNLEGIIDASAKSVAKRAKEYFDIKLKNPRITQVYTIDADLNKEEIKKIRENIFEKETRIVSEGPANNDFEQCIWWGLKPGVKDNEGEVAQEATEFILGRKFKKGEEIYVSNYLTYDTNLERTQINQVASLLANPNIENHEVMMNFMWDEKVGVGPRTSKVEIEKEPSFRFINFNISDSVFEELNRQNNWALHTEDFHYIKDYFYNNKEFTKKRVESELTENPTDIEIECLAQSLSDHCAHRTFRGKFEYNNLGLSNSKTIDDLFETFIKKPTEQIAKENDWIVSVLKDNAGAMFLDKNGEYVVSVKGETHNSPSNKEPYGGSYTGIAGIFRDIMGFGRGMKVIMGLYGFAVGPRDYNGFLKPEIPPAQLLDGIVKGVRDGGNKHGVPTTFGNVFFDESFLAKSLVYVTTLGVSDRIVNGRGIEEKKADPGDLLIIYGGRTGIDGIHGVTEASMGFSEQITMGHVQKGDSYLQRKAGEFLDEATKKGLIKLSWDLGGGGLSSAITETARSSGGVKVDLDNLLLKYDGLDLWQMWVSESQERMLAAVNPERIEEFKELAKIHDVELSVMGEFTDSEAVHIQYKGDTCGYLPLELIHEKPPQWKFVAEWIPPACRLNEPVISEPSDHNKLLEDMLSRPNIASKEWVTRQYDHEVKGGSVIKHMVGVDADIQGPAIVSRPILERREGIAVTQTFNPTQSKIDGYHMTANVIDEALRRIAAVGGVHFKEDGTVERVGLVDNYCSAEVRAHLNNPDAPLKAANLVRSLEAALNFELFFGLPFLSGKDSMYIDGNILGMNGERHRKSGLLSLQVTAIGSVDDVNKCVSMDVKYPNDLVYVIGKTKNELGASEFYDSFGYTGVNIPKVDKENLRNNLIAVSDSIDKELVASVQPIMRGGLGVDLAKSAAAGGYGVDVDLSQLPQEKLQHNYQALYSESGSRFIITINPNNKGTFEEILEKNNCDYACIGKIREDKAFNVTGLDGKVLIDSDINSLKSAYKSTFGGLV